MQLVQEGPKQQGKAGFDTERGAKFYRFKVHQHTGDGDIYIMMKCLCVCL